MLIKYQSHGAAKSPELRNGVPEAWPRVEEQVPNHATLSAPEVAAGFVLLTLDEWQAIRAENGAAFDAWAAATAAAQKQSETTKRTEVLASVVEVESAMNAWQSADEKSRGDTLLKLLHLILRALRDLGAELPPMEKPR